MEPVTVCGNCEKEIPSGKMRMHEAQCRRLNMKCPKCNQVILKAD